MGHKSQLEESWGIIRDKPDRGSERKRALETSLHFNFPFKEMGFVASYHLATQKKVIQFWFVVYFVLMWVKSLRKCVSETHILYLHHPLAAQRCHKWLGTRSTAKAGFY